MHMKKTAKFVLLLDANSAAIRQTAMNLAGSDGCVLMAHTPAAAVEFAKQYKPAYAVAAKSQTAMDGTALLLEFSPETEIVLISSEEAQAAVGQSA